MIEQPPSRTSAGSENFLKMIFTCSRKYPVLTLLSNNNKPLLDSASGNLSELSATIAKSCTVSHSAALSSSGKTHLVSTPSTTTLLPSSRRSVSSVRMPRSSLQVSLVSSRQLLHSFGFSSSSTTLAAEISSCMVPLQEPYVYTTSAAISPLQTLLPTLPPLFPQVVNPPWHSFTSGPLPTLPHGMVPHGSSTPRCSPSTSVHLVKHSQPPVTGSSTSWLLVSQHRCSKLWDGVFSSSSLL